MAINNANIDFLFDVMKFYDKQYNGIADSCFDEVNRALNEICESYLKQQQITVLPFGSYALKNNYQVIEPIEFYCILPANKDVVLSKEAIQKRYNKKK